MARAQLDRPGFFENLAGNHGNFKLRISNCEFGNRLNSEFKIRHT